jgi:acetylglutamate kinase
MTATVTSAVIKVGGRAQSDARLASRIANYWKQWLAATPAAGSAPGVCCVVHGGGDEVTALQRAAGIEPTFVDGRRVTRADDIDRLRMALSGLSNKRLVAALTRVGVHAIGLSGEDGPLLFADVLSGGSLGAVGTVRTVDAALLRLLVANGYLPVIAPVAAMRAPVGRERTTTSAAPPSGVDGLASALNVNGDDAAAAIAVAVGAGELLLVSDVAAVRIEGQPVAELSPAVAEQAIADGQIVDGMVAKVRAALAALDAGVVRVRIGTLDLLDSPDRGTVLTRPARSREMFASTSQGAAA